MALESERMSSSRLYQLLRAISWITFNFTRSDFKTVVVPVVTYGSLASPHWPSGSSMALALVWIWLHLLQFCAANQMFSVEEDSMNKPYRPVPAGLISVHKTQILRWTLVPVCLSLSWALNVLLPGASLTGSFILYNELHLHRHFYSKSLLNAIGIVSWDVGAAKIVRGLEDTSNTQSPGVWIAPYVSFVLIASTIHVQDFRDEAGDRKQGRKTLPVAMPELSRQLTCALLVVWSLGLAMFWRLHWVTSSWFVALGVYVAQRVLKRRTEREDKISLRIYMLWLCIAQTLPFHGQ